MSGKARFFKKSASGSKNDSSKKDDDWKVAIGKNRYVTVNEFRQKIRVDIREFYVTCDGEERPGKKGISLTLEDWAKLKDKMDDIDKQIKKLSGDAVEDDNEEEANATDSSDSSD